MRKFVKIAVVVIPILSALTSCFMIGYVVGCEDCFQEDEKPIRKHEPTHEGCIGCEPVKKCDN